MINQTYQFITNNQQLTDYCQEILANPETTWIAIDTEFVRVDTYYPQLSLVQIQDPMGNAAIIDPIAIANNDKKCPESSFLNPLVDVLVSNKVTKVFHSARQDIEVLYQLEERMPQNIFDTQIAAVFKKHGDLAGFARVIKAELGVELDKSQTRTNWHARPLTDKQIKYALDDVRYLAPLYTKFLQELTNEQIAAVNCDTEKMLQAELYTINPKEAGARIKNLKGLRAKGIAIVNALAEWREIYAIQHNTPKKWTISDDVIIQIAKRPPKTVQALYKVPNIKSSSVKEFGEQWIELIDEVFQQDVDSLPAPPLKLARASQQEERTMQFLNSYIQQVCDDYQLTPSHVINKDQLLSFIRNPHAPFLDGWRHVLLGLDLLQLLNGEASLRFLKQKIELTSSLN